MSVQDVSRAARRAEDAFIRGECTFGAVAQTWDNEIDLTRLVGAEIRLALNDLLDAPMGQP